MATVRNKYSEGHRSFEGLVLSTGSAKDKARVRRALRRAGVTGWRIAPLGPGSQDFFAAPPSGEHVGPARAWALTYRVRADRDVARAEPAFETYGFGVAPAPSAKRSVRGSLFAEAHLPGSDPHDWTIKMCRVRQAWDISQVPPGRGVLIAHPDTGYTAHPELDAAAVRADLGYDFYEDRSDPKDSLTGSNPGHGTATGSVIVSADDAQVTGIAPASKIVPLRVSDSVIHFSWRRLCAALYWAAQGRLRVASMSLGGPWGGSGALEEAVRFATQNGVILISAAGNNWPSVVYPACFPEVIAVAACNADSEPWSDSSNGPEVDITAPGESVWRARARDDGSYSVERGSGTSYATPAVAGSCALWIAHHGGFNALADRYGTDGVGGVFKEALQASVRKPPGWDTGNFGPGIANAEKLLAHELPASAPARGVRVASRRRSAPSAWERIEAFFPEAAPDRVRATLLSAFGRGTRRASRRIEEVLDELHFHVATDPALRAAIASRSGGARGARRAGGRRIAFAGASAAIKRLLAN